MTLVNDEKSLSGTVSYKYMMLILRTYNGASRRFNLPIKQCHSCRSRHTPFSSKSRPVLTGGSCYI